MKLKKVKINHDILPGLRIIKTTLALIIVMIISICSNELLDPYNMAVVAILAMQDDMAKSFREVKNRIGSTIIGGCFGTISMVIGLITNANILKLLLVPIGILLLLYFCSKLINRKEFIIIACYVFLAITLDMPPEESWLYPLEVMAATLIGSLVAIVINLYNPRKKKKVTIYNVK